MSPISSITDMVVSREDLIYIQESLEELKRQVYLKDNTKKIKDLLSSDIGHIVSQHYKGSLSGSDFTDLADSIDEVLEKLASMDSVSVFMPFQPSQSFLIKLRLRIVEICHINEPFYIRSHRDNSLVAGCVFECGGKYYNFSFGKKVEEYILARL